ncbi:MAG TPA: nucleoside triphosphate pyrophosphohydrolase [Actinomycetes bacterium]|nr:nucleoside triphosphate pyrophosphohydrolase [Actinomycetes bacterium]
MPRVVLVASSPRLPLLFPPQVWRALDAARVVLVLDAGHPSIPALEVAEIAWEELRPAPDTGPAGRDLLLVGQGLDVEGVAAARRQADALLADAAEHGEATLLLPPVNDGPLVQLVADRAARQHVEVEAVYAVGEPKGAALLDLVATETRLRGPGGCPWDAEQTHASLARHLIEESYEVLEAIDEGDPGHLREELGDLLLQVVFHAQIAEDAGEFDVDAVARAIVDKLVRRHPHVFGDVAVSGAEEVVGNWARIKREQEGRDDPLAGIPAALPALQLAAKLQKRAAEEGFAWPDRGGPVAKLREELDELLAVVDAGDDGAEPVRTPGGRADWELGDLLFAAVALALASGVEPEGALRRAARRFRGRFTRARDLALAEGLDPAGLQPDDWLGYWARAKRLA